MPGLSRIKAKGKPHKTRARLKRSMLQALDLPMETETSVPKLTMVGRGDLLLENHSGILQCTKEQIRLTTQEGVLRVEGKNLVLLELSQSRAYIRGEISGAKYDLEVSG